MMGRSGTLVFGGRGFVGAAVCKELAKRNATPILSLGRSEGMGGGGPVDTIIEQKSGIDALRPETFAPLLKDAKAIVISIGLPPWITNREKALTANGLTNTSVLKAAVEHKVPRIVVVNATMPTWGLMQNYREGKMMAEAEARKYSDMCDDSGVLILKPGVVSGTRYVGPVPLPLWLMFAPMRFLFQTFSYPCRALERLVPALFGGCLRPAVYAEELAEAAADAIEDPDFKGVHVLHPEDLVGYKPRIA
jgi:nucleoside-diphosphate-sugar epimerase